MVEWSREYYIDPSTTGLNAVYRSEPGTSTAAEGETNGTDGGGGGGAIVVMETPEPQTAAGLTTAAGRQMRGSFSTLRAEAGEWENIIIVMVFFVKIIIDFGVCVCVCS